ncbi:6-phosphofructo-2-kinase-domain-containing protein [Catenaria anguillulae PL171]|uniref:6-phosphofructo-2-kinase-domain-containing protein n=1 Tax=Catenaria anguillulae PL171 TaxID=765915 RepID=A0A1Y2HFX7_9FUNG|nr:6-phosphofructo-2-kinase-domain-containing protein [Catenaria anguillulae PL171]
MTNNHKLACVMVGLPARGKTYISQKVSRYLAWMGTSCRVFNVGQYRRKTAGTNCRSDFFDPTNKEAIVLRNEAASMALADMFKWFEEDDGCVAIFDATNTTRERRERVSICHDPEVIINNIHEVKISGPDYAGMDPETATEDFKARMRHYEKSYETLTEQDLSFIKLINVGSLVIVNLIKGWLQSRIVYFLMNLHTQPRRILFSRHGESIYNQLGLLGGDSDLSPRGQLYAKSLPAVIRRALQGANLPHPPHPGSSASPSGTASGSTTPALLPSDGTHTPLDLPQLTVWTSTLKRTQQTAAYLPYTKLAWKALDELDAGVCDGMTYEEIELKYPEDYLERDKDKFRYRYRGGESYHDVVVRLEPIIMELERQRNILIIGHQAVLRCIYAYFMKIPLAELPYIKIPLHTVISITPRAYGCDEERSTFRPSTHTATHADPHPRANRHLNTSPSPNPSHNASPLRSAAATPINGQSSSSSTNLASTDQLLVHPTPVHPQPHAPHLQSGPGQHAYVPSPLHMSVVSGLAVKLKATAVSAVAPSAFPDSPLHTTPKRGEVRLAGVSEVMPVSSAGPSSPKPVIMEESPVMGKRELAFPLHVLDGDGDGAGDGQAHLEEEQGEEGDEDEEFVYNVNKPHLLEVDVAEAGADPGVKVTVVEPEPVSAPVSATGLVPPAGGLPVGSVGVKANEVALVDGVADSAAAVGLTGASKALGSGDVAEAEVEEAVIGGEVVP